MMAQRQILLKIAAMPNLELLAQQAEMTTLELSTMTIVIEIIVLLLLLVVVLAVI